MAKTISLNMPKPCPQQRDSMAPVNGGRYCAVCEKKLIDYTAMTDEEVAVVAKANLGNCGIFLDSQLNRALPIPQKNMLHTATAVAAMGLATLLSNPAQAQDTPTEKTPLPIAEKPSATKERTINGTVFNNSDTPLEGITVTVKGTGRKTVTNADGKFTIEVKNGEVLHFSGQYIISSNVPVTGSMEATPTFEINMRVIRCGRYF